MAVMSNSRLYITHLLRWLGCGWFGLLLCFPNVYGQDKPLNPTDVFQLPPGLEVTLWARTPDLRNPTNIDIDSRGRIWVAEAVNYRGFQEHRNAATWREEGDRIVILEDTDLDGRADCSKVFVQDKDLVAPLGIAVMGNRILVSCSPHLLMYTDTNGDAHFDPEVDKKEKLLTGFGGFNHDHGLHSVVAGPDGRWYLNAGNAGPHIVTDRDGWTLRAGSSYTGGTPYNTNNTPGLKSDDGRIYVGGLAMSIRPDGTDLSVYAHNFRNNYEICLDSLGNMFQNDNDDQVVSCRTTWLMEHANAGYASADGSRTWQADRRPGQSIPIAHWHQEDPGVIPFGDLYGAGSPTGMAVYEGDLFGPEYRGMLMSCEAGRNVVWGYQVRAKDAGYELKRFSLLASAPDNPDYQWNIRKDDPRRWFRPSDVAVGTDGTIFVADWFDPVVGGHAMDDREASGAIYRIVPKASSPRHLTSPNLDLESTQGQVQALKSPAVNVRFEGFEALKAQGHDVLREVKALFGDENPYVRARGIWLMAQLGGEGRKEVERLLGSKHTQDRLVAVRALEAAGASMLDLALSWSLAEDFSPAVRREIALAMRDESFMNAKETLLTLAEGYDGEDRWYLEAWGTGCDGKENAIYSALLGRMGAMPLEWEDRFADLVWRLHPSLAVVPLKLRAHAESLPFNTRKQALETLVFIPSRRAAEAVMELSSSGPEDLRELAVWWVNYRSENDWSKYNLKLSSSSRIAAETGIFLPPEPAYSSAVIRKGDVVDIRLTIEGATKLYLVVTDAGDGMGCDWADWIEPRLINKAGVEKPLTSISWDHATTGWGEVHVNKNARGLPLKVDGHPVLNGIGTHANSAIVYNLPEGPWSAFVSRAGLDNGREDLGGTDYPGCNPSVIFQVYHDGPSERERTLALQRVLLDPATPAEQRRNAASSMAQSATGGEQLLALADQEKLPKELKPVVARHIHSNPSQMVRIRAGRHFPIRGSDEETSLPNIHELLQHSGDASRGRELFFGRAACSTCHTIHGEGGSLGPDLTYTGSKLTPAAILDSLLNPSASIAFGFEGTVITLKDGETVTGFLLGAGDPILIKDISTGERRAIPGADVEKREPSNKSLMPEASGLGLQAQDLADLTAYLSGLTAENQ